jgi:hypothetical protein
MDQNEDTTRTRAQPIRMLQAQPTEMLPSAHLVSGELSNALRKWIKTSDSVTSDSAFLRPLSYGGFSSLLNKPLLFRSPHCL